MRKCDLTKRDPIYHPLLFFRCFSSKEKEHFYDKYFFQLFPLVTPLLLPAASFHSQGLFFKLPYYLWCVHFSVKKNWMSNQSEAEVNTRQLETWTGDQRSCRRIRLQAPCRLHSMMRLWNNFTKSGSYSGYNCIPCIPRHLKRWTYYGITFKYFTSFCSILFIPYRIC